MFYLRTLITALLLAVCGVASAVTYVDRSGTITTGGTSQTLAAANPTRGRIAITNHPTETEVLCVNVTSAASCSTPGSWVLAPGETIVLDSNELITVVATTTGHKFTAKENITEGFAINVSGSTSISGGAGDASAANQVTGNASLASIDGKMVAGSGATSAATQRVVAATDSPEVAGIGGVSDAAATQGSTGSVSAKLRTVTSQLNTIDGKLVGGAGAVGSSTLRTTQASDSPLVTVAGATGDSAATAGSTGSISAKLRLMTTQLDTLNTSVNADPNYTQAPGSAAPSRALAMGARSGANLVAVSQANATAAINVSTATTTQLVALSSGQVIHVTAASVISAGTGNITFVYGTGTACGTGTTSITGAYPLIANSGLSIGSGLGPVFVVPAGNALCVTTSAAVQMSGHVAYTQFTP